MSESSTDLPDPVTVERRHLEAYWDTDKEIQVEVLHALCSDLETAADVIGTHVTTAKTGHHLTADSHETIATTANNSRNALLSATAPAGISPHPAPHEHELATLRDAFTAIRNSVAITNEDIQLTPLETNRTQINDALESLTTHHLKQ